MSFDKIELAHDFLELIILPSAQQIHEFLHEFGCRSVGTWAVDRDM